ncbi:MAG: hypothetical protein FJW39_34750 [Acidobacteria bacterium]|nr:hypothetical protein [Acidobacteriota bacterium]
MKIEPHPPLISVKQESRLKCQGCVRSRKITLPVFAGEAPGLPGIQQVNVRIPDDLRPMDTNLWLCGIPTTDPVGRVCSLPVRIRISH